MKKDVIYIDIEDDITAIIGKVKAATAKIVALVPPKRTGVLQSAVNLKLLQKSALEGDKRVVLITSDRLLTSLAAGVKLPVALNLQSRPEIPTIPALQVDESDVIDGGELPVGEIAAAAGTLTPSAPDSAADEISKHIDLADAPDTNSSSTTTRPQEAQPAKQLSTQFTGKIKVPNFNRFRKRFFIVGGLSILVIIFFVWAIVIAPTAVITITAKTSAVNVDRSLSLLPALSASQLGQLQLKPTVKQLKKTTSVTFTPTGTKDIGNKAAGTLTIRNCDYASGFTLPSGTNFTAGNGLVFVSTQAVSVPQFTGPASGCTLSGNSSGKATVSVQANDIGTSYNLAAQQYTFPQTGNVDAIGSDMTGGTKDTVTVVSQDDVDKATQKLPQQDATAARQELQQQFGTDQLVIVESFATNAGTPTPSPAVGQQGQQATLSVDTTYTLVSVARSDIHQILNDYLQSTLSGKTDQTIFNSGENTVQFQAFQALSDGTYSARMTTTGYIGTTIDTKQLAQQIKGKRYGEIQSLVNAIPGVDKVDITLSPFWVASAPDNINKITIRFTVQSGGQ